MGKFSTNEEDFVRSNYLSLSVEEMADRLDRPAQSVRAFVKNKNLYKEEDKQHYRYFNRACYPELAYILGWIFSDGHVSNRLCLKISRLDAELIRPSMINVYPLWRSRTVISGTNSNEFIEFMCHKQDTVNFFINEWGFDKKSYGMSDSFFNYIASSSDDCKRCFLRGFFDGDGYVFKPKPFLSIAKRIDFDWTNIIKLIPDNIGYTTRIKDPGTGSGRTSSLEIYRDGPLFFQYIYNASFKLALPRKKDRVLAHFEKPYYRDKYGPLMEEVC